MTLAVARRHQRLERTMIRRIFEAAPPDAINLGLGQPDIVTPEPIREAGRRALADGWTGYSPTAGYADLRAAIASRYEGFAEGTECVVVTAGTEEALVLALFTALDPGDEVLVPDPGFPSYATVASLAGGVPVPYPLRAENRFEIEPSDIATRIGPRTRVVVLCNPGNPAGTVETDATMAEVAALAERHGIAWVSDEIYEAFVYEGSPTSPRRHSRAGVVVSGLSKSLAMTGWRLGWLVAPDRQFAAKATAVHQYLVTCASSLAQRAALVALGAVGAACQREVVDRFRRRRDLLVSGLEPIDGLAISPPRGAFYLFACVDAWGSSVEIARRLLEEEKVVTIPGEAFGEGGRGWLRLSYAAPEDALVEAARRIARFLACTPRRAAPSTDYA